MPAVMVAKYNRYVDNILGRVNKILRKSYDPVRVRLQTVPKNKSNKKKNNKRKKNKPNRKTPTGRSAEEIEFVPISQIDVSSTEKPATNDLVSITALTGTFPQSTVVDTSVTPQENVTPKNSNLTPGNRASNTNRRKTNKNKTKKNKPKSTEAKARGTLFGLATIKRDGDVAVNIMANHRTVRANFLLGPLTLRVEKDFGRGAKKEIRSATATTEEMHGKLNLRIVNGGAATLHSIKVLQPKQVRVDSSDNHDRTREFVWKKSSHIARVVSEKLASATRSMLRPPPKNKK